MCCIRESEDKKSHYCCCCIPIFLCVIGLAVLNGLDLITAISMQDWISTTIYGILMVFFVVGLLIKDGPWRSHLFHSYLVGFILTLIYAIYYCFFSGNTQDNADLICRSVTKAFTWENCENTVEDYMWWFVALYLILLILVRLFFVRILHAFKEQGQVRAAAADYNKLSGEHHHDADHHHDNGHGNNMH